MFIFSDVSHNGSSHSLGIAAKEKASQQCVKDKIKQSFQVIKST